MNKTIVIALGGNALQISGEEPSYENQREHVTTVVHKIIELIKQGYKIVITHGNGPQVGRLLLQQSIAETEETPSYPFDAVSSMSQATIGYQIEQVLKNALKKAQLNHNVTTLITQVQVDPDDEAFKNPSKPIGPYYSQEEMEKLQSEEFIIKADANRGFRRVVASPSPQKIVEFETINTLINHNDIVICCGGGGIPVVERNGEYQGIAAVIDKDQVSSLLARELAADYLVILTAVREAAINFGQANQKSIKKVNLEEINLLVKQGHFAKGSMLPKIQASIDFVQATKQAAIITDLDSVITAINEETIGTIIKTK